MGVPSLFRELVQKVPDVVSSVEKGHKCDFFLLDFNCLIHGCKQNIPENSINQEEDLIAEVVSYTRTLICDIVKPQKLTYIAVDGSVPRAKMERQRARRYKKVQDEVFESKLKEKYNIEQKGGFNSNKITPGTAFMAKLCNRLQNFSFLGNFATHTKNENYKVIFSGVNVPGEGETKIFKFVRNIPFSKTCTIYGLDADLIILSMNSRINHISLLREPQNTSSEIMETCADSQFIVFNIDMCKDELRNQFHCKHIEMERFISDFSFLSFLGGNDFVPALPHTKMRDNGLDKILNTYAQLAIHIINSDNTINYENFQKYIQKLCQNENLTLSKMYQKFGVSKPNDSYENELNNYYHLNYLNRNNPFNFIYSTELNSFKNKSYPEWCKNYEDSFFMDSQEKVCAEYFKALQWTWDYYNGVDIAWDFCFKYRVAPMSSKLATFKMSKIVFDTSAQPMSPICQLMCVCPPQNANLLPYALQPYIKYEDSPISYMYPRKIKLDAIAGLKNIYSEPLLPELNFDEIYKVFSNVEVSLPETIRNKTFPSPYIAKKKQFS